MMATSAQFETLGDKKTESSQVKSKPWDRRLAKFLFRVSVSIVVLLFFAQLIWRFSGSNQWELVQAKDGIKIYSLKVPGSDLLQLRAIGRIHSTLSGVVAWMEDPDACKVQGCTGAYEIERAGDQLHYYYFQYDYSPFSKRDFVVSAQLYQNPNTKQVLISVAAAADKVPPRDGYFRVTNLNNQWRLTPLENGQVEVEVENNMDPGGFVPTALFNMKRPKGMYYILTHLESWVGGEKYQHAKLGFIQEKNGAAPSHISQASTAP